MRLDVWLDIACIFKTRSDAQRACRVGRVSVNGEPAKPHRETRVGDQITVDRSAGRRQTVVVRAMAEVHVSKAVARTLYEDRTPPPSPQEVELKRLERLARGSLPPLERPSRRHQRAIAQRKWRT
ncbi:MAG: RNA-binding S4 domain-containing protein [Acidobacteriota bacterium]